MNDVYFDLDDLSSDGTFTEPMSERVDIAAIVKYCKSKNINSDELSNEEIETFIIRDSIDVKKAVLVHNT
jgi:alpha/beta superfamily hydrolase